MTIQNLVARTALIAVTAASLGACASQQVGGGYEVPRYSAGEVQRADYGTVLSARPIVFQGTRSGAGAVTGAVVGGVAGSSIGGGNRAHIIGGVAGAVVGGLVGDAVEEGVTRQKGMEYTIRLDGRRDPFVVRQGLGYDIRPGDRVQVIYDDRGATVVPASRY